MTMMDAIKKRRSVRTFDGVPLREEDLRRILDFAEGAENPYGQPMTWALLDAKKSGLRCRVITGTDTFLAGKTVRAPHAEEAFGYTFEQIVLFAESLGVGTTWIAGTFDRPAFEKAAALAPGEVMPCVSPLGYPAQKYSLIETMMRKTISADTRRPFESLYFRGDFDTPLSPAEAGELQQPLAAVRLSPSAVNKQPWRVLVCGDKVHFYEKKSKPGAPDAWDIQRVDLGIALCHFDLIARECGIAAAFTLEDPGISAPEGCTYIATFVITR